MSQHLIHKFFFPQPLHRQYSESQPAHFDYRRHIFTSTGHLDSHELQNEGEHVAGAGRHAVVATRGGGPQVLALGCVQR